MAEHSDMLETVICWINCILDICLVLLFQALNMLKFGIKRKKTTNLIESEQYMNKQPTGEQYLNDTDSGERYLNDTDSGERYLNDTDSGDPLAFLWS
jgi:hypothetical protein